MDEHVHEVHEAAAPFSTNPNPGLSEFPSKHPMIVHFPIVLLLVAFFTQLASFFIWGKELSMVTLVLLAGGAIGAYIASNFAHPHTTELNDVAAQLLTLHEDYAAYAKWSSIVALVLKTISHFFLKRKLWGEILIALILAGSVNNNIATKKIRFFIFLSLIKLIITTWVVFFDVKKYNLMLMSCIFKEFTFYSNSV